MITVSQEQRTIFKAQLGMVVPNIMKICNKAGFSKFIKIIILNLSEMANQIGKLQCS